MQAWKATAELNLSAVRWAASATLLLTALGGCGGGKKAEVRAPSAPPTIRLSSPAFRDGAALPREFTCGGARRSPPLEWSGVPRRAAELALVLEDPDAAGGNFTHWTVFGIAPSTSHIGAGALPPGARAGRNSFGTTGYGPPCPPRGDRPHRYVFTLYALSRPSGLTAGASPSEVTGAVGSAAIGQGRLTATYRR